MAVEDDYKLFKIMTMKCGKPVHLLINGKFILICLPANKKHLCSPTKNKLWSATAGDLYTLHV